VVKNKLAPPFREAEFDIEFSEGISRAGSILDVATDMGILQKKGAWFSLDGEQLGQGRDQTKALIKENVPLQEKILALIKAKGPAATLSRPAAPAAEAAEPEAEPE